MAEPTKTNIGKCFCLHPPNKHFIIASIEESIQNREKEIDLIKKGEEEKEMDLIIKGETNIRRIKEIITSHEKAVNMIHFHRSTKVELTKLRNMVSNIPNCQDT